MRRVIGAVLAVGVVAHAGVARPDHAHAIRGGQAGGAGALTDRTADVRASGGRVEADIPVPGGSHLVASLPDPKCRLRPWEQRPIIELVETTDAEGNVTIEPQPIGTEWFQSERYEAVGTYQYVEVEVDESRVNTRLSDAFAGSVGLGAWRCERVLRIRAVDLQAARRVASAVRGALRYPGDAMPPADATFADGVGRVEFDATRYPGRIDIGPWDPLFDLQGTVDQLDERLDLMEPVVQAPPVVNAWGGLVVRSPA